MIEQIGRRAALHPGRNALIAGERRVSYGELWARIGAVAQQFAGCGVVPGDRVLLAAPSTPAFIYGYLGAHLVGAVAIPIDPHAPLPRREELVRRVAPRLVFGMAGGHDDLLGKIRALDELETLSSDGATPKPPSLDALADLLFTTGTTGRSKGVRLTHGNIATAAGHINAVIRCRDEDVEVLPLPLYHAFGLGRLRCNLVAGRTVVLVDGFRLPGEIFRALEEHRAAGLVGVPAGFAILLRFGARGLGAFSEQLHHIEIGSAPMPPEHKRQLMELLPNTELWMHYGLTEAARSAFIEFHRHSDRLDTVGLAAPGVRTSIRTEDGSELEPGEAGMLWIGGAHVSPGYWDDPEQTTKSFVAGWVRTGDVAYVDPDGFIHLHGRKDDMIKVGGFNVAPDEIERVLCEHPAVQEAACIGIPDPRKIAGQTVIAYVVRKADRPPVNDTELCDWVAAQLEPYKVPSGFRWVDSLPRTASGKLVRRVLRDDGVPGQG